MANKAIHNFYRENEEACNSLGCVHQNESYLGIHLFLAYKFLPLNPGILYPVAPPGSYKS